MSKRSMMLVNVLFRARLSTWPLGEPGLDDAVEMLVWTDHEPVDYLDGES